jgi:hypothetical protein
MLLWAALDFLLFDRAAPAFLTAVILAIHLFVEATEAPIFIRLFMNFVRAPTMGLKPSALLGHFHPGSA